MLYVIKILINILIIIDTFIYYENKYYIVEAKGQKLPYIKPIAFLDLCKGGLICQKKY